MSQAPAMPLFVADLISDTTELTRDEFGAYLLLLCKTWSNNGKALLDDDCELARICRTSTANWRNHLRSKLIRFFDTSDGYWHQKRLEKEWAYVQKIRAERSASGKRGADARWKNSGQVDQPDYQDHPDFLGANPLKPHDLGHGEANGKPIALTLTPTLIELDSNESNICAIPPKKPKKLKEEETEFEQWWKACPKRVGKADARKAYWKARNGGASWASLLAGIRSYTERCRGLEERFVKHPATWLNKGCWEDDPEIGAAEDEDDGRVIRVVDESPEAIAAAWRETGLQMVQNGTMTQEEFDKEFNAA